MIYIDQSEGITKEKIINKAVETNAKEILLLAETEWECHFGGRETIDELAKMGVTLKVIHGAFRNQNYDDLYKNIGLDIEKDVFFWGTFWFNWAEFQLIQQIYHYQYMPPPVFKHPFICLNNRSHLHRCATVEELAKTGLIDKGVVTWHDFLGENPEYPFLHFDRSKKRILNDDFSTKLDSFLLPQEFHESFFHLITEATLNAHFITEKTVIPILLKKPFAVVSSPGFHKKLVELGFKLYDEIIDYSFDDEPDLNTRVSMLVSQLHKMCNNDTSAMFDTVREKLLYNYNRALEIIGDGSLIPSVIKDLTNEYDNVPSFNYRYKCFIEQTKNIKVIPRWHQNHDIFLEEIVNEKDNISDVLLDSLTEAECTYISPFIENCLDLCKELNLPVTLMSPYDPSFMKTFNRMQDPRWKSVHIVSWPLFWLARTFYYMSAPGRHAYNKDLGMDLSDNNVCLSQTDFKFLFISLNNISKNHRCLLMDLLAKQELISKGAISWRDIRGELDPVRHLIPEGMTDSEYAGYPYEYWKPEILLLDQTKEEKFNQEILPVEYIDSFMQLVPETGEDHFFLTEKTSVPLLFNKPFLVAGCVHYHKILESFGFKLYDEIFDYSFDSIEDCRGRYQGIVDNIDKLKNQNLLELRNKIKDKLIYNRKLALEYVFDKWPQPIRTLRNALRIKDVESALTQISDIGRFKNDIY